jgi:putative hydrolase of the HAD superfamily
VSLPGAVAQPRPIRAVLFDAGNTLLFLEYARLAEGVAKVCGIPLTGADLARCAPAAAQALERGDGADQERASAYLERLFRLAGVPSACWPDVRSALYAMHAERHLWSGVDPRTTDALDRLRRRGLRLGVVSNSDGRVEAALTAAGLRDWFDVVIDSRLAGVEKPEPRIFHLALDVLGISPDEALYVGDVYEVDVVGARRAGLRAALVDPAGVHGGRDVPSAPSVGLLVDRLETLGLLPRNRPSAEIARP